MLEAAHILRLHDQATAYGHAPEGIAPSVASPLAELVLHQHQANYALWHREDDARDPDASDAIIARVKHDIDRLNQQRNDLAEQIDRTLLADAAMNPQAPLHSQSPA